MIAGIPSRVFVAIVVLSGFAIFVNWMYLPKFLGIPLSVMLVLIIFIPAYLRAQRRSRRIRSLDQKLICLIPVDNACHPSSHHSCSRSRHRGRAYRSTHLKRKYPMKSRFSLLALFGATSAQAADNNVDIGAESDGPFALVGNFLQQVVDFGGVPL